MEIVQNQIDIPRLTLKTVKQDLKKQRSRLSFGKFRKLRQKLLQKILPSSASMFRRNISAELPSPFKKLVTAVVFPYPIGATTVVTVYSGILSRITFRLSCM